MLDQNTDRSWWMIGSVVIGALLIGLAKLAFPEMFNTVMAFFKSSIPTKLGMVSTITDLGLVSAASDLLGLLTIFG